MYKAVFCLDRKEGMDHEEFREYWTTDHAALADDIPNVVKYTVSFPADPDDAAYDGMATLYYESHEALRESFASEAFTEVEADVPNFADPGSALELVVEERVQFDET